MAGAAFPKRRERFYIVWGDICLAWQQIPVLNAVESCTTRWIQSTLYARNVVFMPRENSFMPLEISSSRKRRRANKTNTLTGGWARRSKSYLFINKSTRLWNIPIFSKVPRERHSDLAKWKAYHFTPFGNFMIQAQVSINSLEFDKQLLHLFMPYALYRTTSLPACLLTLRIIWGHEFLEG